MSTELEWKFRIDLQRYRNLGSRDPKVVLLNHVPVQRNRNRRVRGQQKVNQRRVGT
jgi:hypothetical protein